MKRGSPIHIPERSVGERVRSDIFMMVASCALVYYISSFFRALFSPIKYLTMSREQIDEEERRTAKVKASKRAEYNERIKNDFYDPLNAYLRDPDNPENVAWYKAYKSGDVPDPGLRWAPDIYENKKINGKFLTYLENQILLLNGNDLRALLRTIRLYYPEFTPDMDGIQSDIRELKERICERALRGELSTEIRKLGVPEETAEKIIASGMNPGKIKSYAAKIKKCIENGFERESAECIVDNGIDPDSDDAKSIDKIITSLLLPGEVAIAYIRKQITTGQLERIAEFASSTIKNLGMMTAFGEKAESGECLYIELIRGEVKKYRLQNARS